MLRAVLSKMQQAETLSVMQMDAVLEFLCNLPGPTGKPALEFVMIEWTGRQHMFYGQYEGKVREEVESICGRTDGQTTHHPISSPELRSSAIALCKLLQHGVATHDLRLQDITVRGDQVFSPSEGIRTRSKAARGQVPERWTVIPLPIKIYKLLVNELSVIMESSASRRASAGTGEELESFEEEDEVEDEEEVDDDDDVTGQTLSELFGVGIGCRYDDELYDEEEEDPDAVKDPLYQVDIQVSKRPSCIVCINPMLVDQLSTCCNAT
uniref:Uncharacterized protein n=1 Tax=Eptatretus burgeri TaxID=7764 RepID=A0A8C4QT49_EPTBU